MFLIVVKKITGILDLVFAKFYHDCRPTRLPTRGPATKASDSRVRSPWQDTKLEIFWIQLEMFLGSEQTQITHMGGRRHVLG